MIKGEPGSYVTLSLSPFPSVPNAHDFVSAAASVTGRY